MKSMSLLLIIRFKINEIDTSRKLFCRLIPAIPKEGTFSLANRPAGSIKQVLAGATPEQAIAAFADLWVSDEHWAAADKVMNKAK